MCIHLLGVFNYSSRRLQLSHLPFGIISLCQFLKDPAGCFYRCYQGSSDPAVGDALKCQGVVTYVVAFIGIHVHGAYLVFGLGIKPGSSILPFCVIFQ